MLNNLSTHLVLSYIVRQWSVNLLSTNLTRIMAALENDSYLAIIIALSGHSLLTIHQMLQLTFRP